MYKDFKNLSIFIDESGSTGTNISDFAQPNYVQAGVIVEDQNIDEVIAIYRKWKLRNFQNNVTEVKSTSLFKQERGLRIFIDLWNDVRKHLIPTYAIFEKKFFLAITCVEAFLDSGYNSQLSHDDFFWSNKRNQWAEVIYSAISIETIHLVSNVIHRLSLETFTKARLSLIEDLTKFESELAKLIEACPAEEAYTFLASKSNENDKNNKILSPNVQTFLSHLHSIKREIGNRSVESFAFYIDNNSEFSDSCIQHFHTINAGELRLAPISKDLNIRFGSKGTWSIEKCDSGEHELIQIADLCCGYLNYFMSSVIKGTDIEFKYSDIHVSFWTPLFVDTGVKWYYYGFSNEFKLKFKHACNNMLEGLNKNTKILFTNEEIEKLKNLNGKDKKKLLAHLKKKYKQS